MGVRPKLYQIIGFEVDKVENGKEWVQHFMSTHYNSEFIKIAKNTILNLDDDEDFLEELVEDMRKKDTYEIVEHFNKNEQNIFGIFPLLHLNSSSIYDHDLLYSMIEAQMIEDKSKALKIPYEDFSHLIGKSLDEMKEEIGHIQTLREVHNYSGYWGRRYPNHPMNWFDMDFDFTFNLLQDLGLNIKGNQLDRYIVFEWVN